MSGMILFQIEETRDFISVRVEDVEGFESSQVRPTVTTLWYLDFKTTEVKSVEVRGNIASLTTQYNSAALSIRKL